MYRCLIALCLLLPALSRLYAGPENRLLKQEGFRSPEQPPTQERVELLCRLCWADVYSKPDRALAYGKEALAEAGKLKYNKGKMEAANLTGIAFDVMARYDSALYYYRMAAAYCREEADTALLASNLTNMGLTFWHLGNYKDALTYLLDALHLFSNKKHKYGQASCHNNIGLIYLDLENAERALPSFEKALLLYRSVKNELGEGAVLTNLGRLYYLKKEHPRAWDYFRMAEDLKTRNNDQYGLAMTCRNMGILLMDQKEYLKAAEYLNRSLAYARQVNDLSEECSALLAQSELLLRTGKTGSALLSAGKAFALAKQVNSPKLECEACKLLSDCHAKTGNREKEYYFYRQFKEKEDELVNTSRMNQILDLELHYAEERKAIEIEGLQKEKELQRLQLEKQQLVLRQTHIILIAGAGIFLGFVMVTLLIIREIRHRQKDRLKRQESTLREKQIHEVMKAEMAERKRIGEELHDSLGQTLSMIKLTLTHFRKQLPPSPESPVLESALHLVDSGFTELRTISHNMSPILLQEKGLIQAVRDMLDRMAETRPYRIHFETLGLEKNFSPLLENTLYRVIQEILNNIVQHAEASEIALQITRDSHETVILAEDNGKGFDPMALPPGKGMGLHNLRTRIENLKGSLHIDSTPGRGTIITLTIPCGNESQED